jgi:solute carrier family 36 (proton-coupled amino acid transporter)
MRYAILTSITVSQIGFVSAYIIFVAENLQAFVMAVTKCGKLISIVYLILMQLIIFLPLALIRNLAKLSTTALVADVFILAGLVYIFGSEISIVAHQGVAKVAMFNPKDFPLLIGYAFSIICVHTEFSDFHASTAVFSFEGIGLVRTFLHCVRNYGVELS